MEEVLTQFWAVDKGLEMNVPFRQPGAPDLKMHHV